MPNQEARARHLQAGFHFLRMEGRPPSRLDWMGENLRYYRTKHAFEYPHAKTVEWHWTTWGNFSDAMGAPKTYRPHRISRKAGQLLNQLLGVEELNHHVGAVDGYWQDRPVEIKAASLEQESTFYHYRWRFRLHDRYYSKLVDHFFAVGFDREENPLMVWRFDKRDMLDEIDGRHVLYIPAAPSLLGRPYAYWNNEVWKADLSYEQIMELLNGVTGPQFKTLKEAIEHREAARSTRK